MTSPTDTHHRISRVSIPNPHSKPRPAKFQKGTGPFCWSGRYSTRKAGVPCGIRTHGLLLRRQTLYPAELRGRNTNSGLMAGGAPSNHHEDGNEQDDEGDENIRAVAIRISLRIVPGHFSPPFLRSIATTVMIAHPIEMYLAVQTPFVILAQVRKSERRGACGMQAERKRTLASTRRT